MDNPTLMFTWLDEDGEIRASVTIPIRGPHISHAVDAMATILRVMGYCDSTIEKYIDCDLCRRHMISPPCVCDL